MRIKRAIEIREKNIQREQRKMSTQLFSIVSKTVIMLLSQNFKTTLKTSLALYSFTIIFLCHRDRVKFTH